MMALLPHRREELARLIVDYRSTRQIAAETGISLQYLYVVLRSYGAAAAWEDQPLGSEPAPSIGRLLDDSATAASSVVRCPRCHHDYSRRGAGQHLRRCAWSTETDGDARWLLPGHRSARTTVERTLARLLSAGWTATGISEATRILPARLHALVMQRAPASGPEERHLAQLLDVEIPTLSRGTARRPTVAPIEPDALYD